MGHLFEDHPELAVPQSEVRSMKSEHEELCRRIAVDAVDSFGDAITAIRELSAEVERVAKENDTLRGLLGNSAKPCPYCGLAAEDQAKCASGFPGCARADDQMLSKPFADVYRAELAEAELAKVRADFTQLRYHAGCMAEGIEKGYDATEHVRNYRRDYPRSEG